MTNFSIGYTDRNRKSLLRKYKTFESFDSDFTFDNDAIKELREAGEKNKVMFDQAQYDISAVEMQKLMKGIVARDLWDMNEYYRVVNQGDYAILRAVSVINDPALYEKLLGYRKE